MLNNKSILITGGTGSLGKALTKRILKDYPKVQRLVIFSRDEQKQFQMSQTYNEANYPSIRYFIGDVRDYDSIDNAMSGVDFFFSAAALKQVPACEFYPLEALKTNILGTENVIDSAIKNNVKKLVLLSTDKAVYPINAMGMSKAMAENQN